jgi:hypothetical protein
MGMADGRCLTLNQANQLLYEQVAQKLGVNPLDSARMRVTLENSQEILPAATCGIMNYKEF